MSSKQDHAEPRDYLDRLHTEHGKHVDAIDDIVNRALADERDMTEAEDAECKRHQDEIEKLAPQIERWTKLRETRHETVTRMETARPVTKRAQVVERVGKNDDPEGDVRDVFGTAGAYAMATMKAGRGDLVAREQVQRALAIATTADVPGLLPVTYTGDIRNRITAVRPLVQSGRQMPMPATGMDVRRPKITQHTLVGKQNGEKTELPSRALRVQYDTIPLVTYGGAVNMSIQEAERTDPSALDMTFEDLAAQYGIATEEVTAAELDTLVPIASGPLDLTTATGDDVLAAIYTATGTIYGATSGKTPNVIYAGLGWWSKLGALTKPVNPQNSIANADPGTLTMGIGSLKVVVSPKLDNDFLAVGVSDALEIYENPGAPVQLKALEVGILGYEIGVYGLFAVEVWPNHFIRLDAVA